MLKVGDRIKFITKDDCNIPYGSKGTVVLFNQEQNEVKVDFDFGRIYYTQEYEVEEAKKVNFGNIVAIIMLILAILSIGFTGTIIDIVWYALILTYLSKILEKLR